MPSSRLFWSLSALLFCLLAALALRVGLGSSFFNDHALFASNESDRQRFHLVPILCFHNVDGPGPYSVSRQEFRAYMESIRRAGVQVVPLRTLYQHARENRLFDQPSMVITIDGGEWLKGAGQFSFLSRLTDADWAQLRPKKK